jgi:hypothetical protein
MNEQPTPAGSISLTQVTRTTEGLPTGYTVSQAILTLEDCLGSKLSDIPMRPIVNINTCEVHRLSDQLVVYVLSDDTPSSVTCNIDHDGMVIQVTRATSRDTTVALMRYEAGKFSVDLIRPGDKGLQSTADSSLPPPVLYSRSLEAEFDRYDNSTTLSAGEVLRQFVRITRFGLGRGCGHLALTYGEPEAAPLLPVPWLGVMPITAGVIAVPAQEEQDSPRLEEVAFQLSWNEHGLPTQLSYADTPSDGAPPAGNYAWTVDERGNWTSWQRLPFTAPQIASGGERADVLGQQAPHTGPPPTVCRKITYADGTVSTPPSHLLDLIRTANN